MAQTDARRQSTEARTEIKTGGNRWVIVFALWIPLIFTLGLLFLANRSQHLRDLDAQWVLHTVEVKDQIERLNSLVRDVSVGEREYLVTGDKTYLDLHDNAVKEIPGQSQNLAHLVEDNSKQVAAAAHLQTLIARRLSIAAQTLSPNPQEQFPDTIQLVNGSQGEQLMDDIRSQMQAMMTEEDRLLSQREIAFAAQVKSQKSEMIGLVAVEIALIVGLTLLLLRSRRLHLTADVRIGEAHAMTDHAQASTLKAMARTEQAEVRTEEANARTDEAKVLAQEAVGRTEHAEATTVLLSTCISHLNDIVLITEAGSIEEPGPRIVFANEAFERITGYTPAETLGRSPRFLQGEKTDRGVLDEIHQAVKERKPIRRQIINCRKDGSEFWLDIDIVPIFDREGKCTHFAAIERDVTELKRTDARFRRLVDSNAQGVCFWNLKGGITGANDAFLHLLRFTREDLEAGRINWMAMTPPEYTHLDRRAMEEIAVKGACTPYEKDFIRKDGVRVPVLLGSAAFEDTPNEGVSFFLDLAERKCAAEQIIEQAALLDEAQDAIIVCDLEGTVIFWNKGAERMYGWTRQQVLGLNMSAIIFANPEKFTEVNALTISQGKWSGELQHLTKDKIEITIEARWTLIRDKEGRPKSVLAINTDITDKKKIEAQFMRAQRMESIGTLAGGIAHDLNNILAPIMMSIDILKLTATDPQAMSILDTIEVSSKRGSDIVRQVLSFARGLEGERIEIQPAHLLKDLENIIKNTFPKNIRLQFAIPNDTWMILGDPTQVHQILLNLCVNARDAMPSGGNLTFGVENCVLDEHYAAMHIEAKPGRYVNINVTDTGMGIQQGILDKIFEPFFTTKEIDEGTGLGLSTVMAIVKSHAGVIDVYSEPGKGTTFKVYLPATELSVEAQKLVTQQISVPWGKGETVLVVDDETSILAITSKTLQTFGYRVLTATNGADAVAAYAEHRKEIAVVLTDVSMPIMDGAALIRALTKINPVVKIIAASGLSSNGSVTKLNEPSVKHFLTKPYTAKTLLKTLRAILDEVENA